MVHLRMTGQLLLAPGRRRPGHRTPTSCCGSTGDPPEELWFVDPRTFGEVVVFDPDHVDVELPELARLGLDPLADGIDARTLQALLAGRRTKLKPLLLDQAVIAGIGNIYADEILHGARLHPDRVAGSLKRAEVVRLHDTMHDVLLAAVGAGGSTLGRQPVRRPDGLGRFLPGRPPGLRAGRGALHDVRPGDHPPHGVGGPFDALLPDVPARCPVPAEAAATRRG